MVADGGLAHAVDLRIPVETVRDLAARARGLEGMSRTLAGALAAPDEAGDLTAAGWTSAVHMYFESPALHAFHRALAALPDWMQAELIALMWLGRESAGDQAAGLGTRSGTWPELLSQAWMSVADADLDVLKLVGHNRLSEYLETGLKRLGAGAS